MTDTTTAPAAIPLGSIVEILEGAHKGRRALVTRVGMAGGKVGISTQMTANGSFPFGPHELRVVERGRRSAYEMDDYAAVLQGVLPIPNWEPMELPSAINALASASYEAVPGVFHTNLSSDPATRTAWTRVFLARGQGGQLTGEGLMLRYGAPSYPDGRTPVGGGTAGRFTLCKHQKVTSGSANPSRGWHPGACALCGLDMTVDSGD